MGVWNTSNGFLKLQLKGHDGPVNSVQYDDDSKYIVSASSDKSSRIWDATSGVLIKTLSSYATSLWISQDSPDGKYFATSSEEPNIVLIWNAKSGQPVRRLIGHKEFVLFLQFSPNSKQIATASSDATVKIWDIETGKIVHDLVGHEEEVYSVCYSPDGNSISTASGDKSVKIWDLKTGHILKTLNGHTRTVWSTQYSPDGKYLSSTSTDKSILIWEVSSGFLIKRLIGHEKAVYSAPFSPDGKLIVSTSWDKTAKIWDRVSGKLLHDINAHSHAIRSANFSADGESFVTASFDSSAKIWDTKSGRLLHILDGHTSMVSYASYKPKRNIITTSSLDGSVVIWDAKNGKKLMTMFALFDNNWAVVHSSGLFDASAEAMKWMYYLVGREVIDFEQLKERYYEPGLFLKLMNGEPLRDVEQFGSLKMYPLIESQIKNDSLIIKLHERNGGIGKISLIINRKEVIHNINQEVQNVINIGLRKFEKHYFQDTINFISLIAYNEEGWLKSSPYQLEYQPEFPIKEDQGNMKALIDINYRPSLYGVIVGTSDYVGEQLDLKYADKDAEYINQAISQSSQALFGKENSRIEYFSTTTVSGAKLATKRDIKEAFNSLSTKADPRDILFVYLSGHGVSYGGTENEQFYYLTKDCRSGDIRDPAIRENYTISTEELTQWISDIPARKQVMIIDACSSGQIVEDLTLERDVPTSQIRALDRMKDRTGMFVLAGSAADKVSYEASQFGQGLLTYSLLQGMSGDALRNGIDVDVSTLFQFARDKVPEYAEDIGGIQKPVLFAPLDASSFDIGQVTDEVDIPLEQIKPVFIQSSFMEEESLSDLLDLGIEVDNYLDGLSYSAGRGIIFVDVKKKKNAYNITGRYTIDGSDILLDGRLFRNKELLGKFEIREEKENIAERLVEEVSRIINHK